MRCASRRWVRALLATALAAMLAVGGCAQLAYKERELVFRVEPGDASWFSGVPEGVRETSIAVGEGQRLHAWWWPAAKEDAPALLYLHGSRWNLTGHLFRLRQLREFGFSVLAIDYRGFGKSLGDVPSEETVYEDAQAAWTHLAQLQPTPTRRYIYGHSLGGAVAIELAHRLAASPVLPQAGGLIVESSFTTLGDVAEAVADTRWPIRWLLSQKFDSLEKIGAVNVPVLLVHGTADRYVPPRFTEALFAAAKAPKRLLLVDGGTHNNSMRRAPDAYLAALRELFGLKREL